MGETGREGVWLVFLRIARLLQGGLVLNSFCACDVHAVCLRPPAGAEAPAAVDRMIAETAVGGCEVQATRARS